MIVAASDTHATIWYIFNDSRLSAPARALFERAVASQDQVGVSSITLVELAYLGEKGRVALGTGAALEQALDRPNSVLVELPVDRHIAAVIMRVSRSQVPDMPDRIIAATALFLGVPLLSRDAKIRASGIATIW